MNNRWMSVAKKAGALALRLIGLENRVRQELASKRQPPIASVDPLLRCHHGASAQYLMDLHPSSRWHSTDFVSRFGGFSPPGEPRAIEDCFPHDRVRSDQIVLLLREIEVRHIEGSIAELGVHRGASARLLHQYCPQRRLYLFDTFTGFSADDMARESLKLGFNERQSFTDTSLELVLRHIGSNNGNVIPLPGWFPSTVTPQVESETFAFVHLDADLEEPIAAGLAFFAPRVAAGGFILVHDFNAWPGARIAVEAFVARHKDWVLVPLADKSGSALLSRPRQS